MMFDPEKVERESDPWPGTWVRAAEYDQLLELYRGLAEWASRQRDLPQGLWPRQRYEHEAARQKQGHCALEPLTREISLGATQTAIGNPAQNGKVGK